MVGWLVESAYKCNPDPAAFKMHVPFGNNSGACMVVFFISEWYPNAYFAVLYFLLASSQTSSRRSSTAFSTTVEKFITIPHPILEPCTTSISEDASFIPLFYCQVFLNPMPYNEIRHIHLIFLFFLTHGTPSHSFFISQSRESHPFWKSLHLVLLSIRHHPTSNHPPPTISHSACPHYGPAWTGLPSLAMAIYST